MSRAGMPSVMQMTSLMPASAASTIASGANGAGTKMMWCWRRSLDGLGHGVVDRHATSSDAWPPCPA